MQLAISLLFVLIMLIIVHRCCTIFIYSNYVYCILFVICPVMLLSFLYDCEILIVILYVWLKKSINWT